MLEILQDPEHGTTIWVAISFVLFVILAVKMAGKQVVATLDSKIAAIKSETKNMLSAVEFNEGHRYADFLPGKDKAAAYGLAGLIVGATAAKAGFLKVLWVGILAFKKVIFVGLMALAAALRRFFVRKPQESISAETTQ